jgi:hypothetical protein
MPIEMLLSSHFASARVTRMQPWLAGPAGTLFEPWMAQPR